MPDIEIMLREAAADLPLPSDDATGRALRRLLACPEPTPRPRRCVPRLTTRVVLVAAALLVLGGGIAIAFGGRIADLISNDPGPSTIHRAFQRVLVPVRQGGRAGEPYAGRPIRSSERLVVERPSRWGGELRIYEARSTLGSTCYLLVRTVALGASCELRPVLKPGKPINLISTIDATMHSTRTVHTEYAGRPYSARAVAVRVVFRGGGSERIVLKRGWFFYEPPRAHAIGGGAPVVAIDVLDGRGATLAGEPIPANSLTSILQPQPVLPIASTVRLLQRSTLPNGGGRVAIWSARDANGDWCLRYLRNGRSQHSPAWNCGPAVGRYWYDINKNSRGKPLTQIAHELIFWGTYGRGGPGFPKPYVYAVGWAAPGIARLELTYQDGTHSRIPLHGRFYLFLVPASHWDSGARPKTIMGLTAAGHRAGVVDLRPDRVGCYYPSEGCSFATG